MPNLRGIYVLRENLVALMRSRGMTQDELATAVGRKKSWLNKFLKGSRQIQLVDIDRMADYLGVSTYQLFQPGLSRMAERRVGERRTGADRRVALSLRTAELPPSAAVSNSHHVGVSGHNGRAVSAADNVPEKARELFDAAVRIIADDETAQRPSEAAQARARRAGKTRRR